MSHSFEVSSTEGTVDVLVQWTEDLADGMPDEHGQQRSVYTVTLDRDEIWVVSFPVEATSIDEASMIAERRVSAFLQDGSALFGLGDGEN